MASHKSGNVPSPGTPTYRDTSLGVQKRWSSERVPGKTSLSRKNTIATAMLPFNDGRTLPSKWEDVNLGEASESSHNGLFMDAAEARVAISSSQIHVVMKEELGTIPNKFGNCKSLKTIDLSVNSVSGSIPQSFENLSTLEKLMLSDVGSDHPGLSSSAKFETQKGLFPYHAVSRVEDVVCPDQLHETLGMKDNHSCFQHRHYMNTKDEEVEKDMQSAVANLEEEVTKTGSLGFPDFATNSNASESSIGRVDNGVAETVGNFDSGVMNDQIGLQEATTEGQELVELQNMVVLELEDCKLVPLHPARPLRNYTPGETRGGIDQSDVKPLEINQPEGPSFRVNEHFVEWQKWNFCIGFILREGLVTYSVAYIDGSRGRRPMVHRTKNNFWNFDALFQPQQRPAHDSHDTFFLKVGDRESKGKEEAAFSGHKEVVQNDTGCIAVSSISNLSESLFFDEEHKTRIEEDGRGKRPARAKLKLLDSPDLRQSQVNYSSSRNRRGLRTYCVVSEVTRSDSRASPFSPLESDAGQEECGTGETEVGAGSLAAEVIHSGGTELAPNLNKIEEEVVAPSLSKPDLVSKAINVSKAKSKKEVAIKLPGYLKDYALTSSEVGV